jgi:eukaryotic-like serine/threonine-protein kinase
MAPEQLTNLIDPRSDIFSLGVVLWELLSGQSLFEGSSDEEVAEQIRSRPIRPPSTYLPEIPPAVDAIALKALQRNPTDRYQTARDLALALDDLHLAPPVDAFELGRELRRLFPEPPATALDVALEPPTQPGLQEEPTAPELHPPATEELVTAPDGRAPLDPAAIARTAVLAPRSVSRSGSRRFLLPLSLGILAAALAVLPLMTKKQRQPNPEPEPRQPMASATPVPAAAPPLAEPPSEPPASTPLSAPAPTNPLAPSSEAGAHRRPALDPTARTPAELRPAAPRHHHKPGTLAVIAVRPWVQVFVDGVSRGYSPAPAIPTSAGRHQIILSNEEVGLSRTFSVVVPEAGRVVFRGEARTLEPSAEDHPIPSTN